jgi:hypothetical protein
MVTWSLSCAAGNDFVERGRRMVIVVPLPGRLSMATVPPDCCAKP